MPNPTSKLNLVINGNTTQLDIHDSNAVDLTNNQTVAGNKEFTGTTTAHDVVPSATDTYNFGSPSYQWNNAYIKSLTINGVAAGDILTHNVSEFVGVTGAQTIGGVKTFSEYVRIQGSYKGNEFSPNARTVLEFRANRDVADKSGIYLTKFRQNRAQGEMGDNNIQSLAIDVLENGVRTNDLFRFTFKGWVNDVPTTACLEPYSSNTQAFLGTSLHKWKDVGTNAINGLNPGALSLPSISSGINLDLTNFKTDGSENRFRLTSFSNYPYDNGWLFVRLIGCTSYYLDHWYKVVSNSYTTPSEAIFFLPISDKDHDITLKCVCTSINYIRVFPCQGNV